MNNKELYIFDDYEIKRIDTSEDGFKYSDIFPAKLICEHCGAVKNMCGLEKDTKEWECDHCGKKVTMVNNEKAALASFNEDMFIEALKLFSTMANDFNLNEYQENLTYAIKANERLDEKTIYTNIEFKMTCWNFDECYEELEELHKKFRYCMYKYNDVINGKINDIENNKIITEKKKRSKKKKKNKNKNRLKSIKNKKMRLLNKPGINENKQAKIIFTGETFSDKELVLMHNDYLNKAAKERKRKIIEDYPEYEINFYETEEGFKELEKRAKQKRETINHLNELRNEGPLSFDVILKTQPSLLTTEEKQIRKQHFKAIKDAKRERKRKEEEDKKRQKLENNNTGINYDDYQLLTTSNNKLCFKAIKRKESLLKEGAKKFNLDLSTEQDKIQAHYYLKMHYDVMRQWDNLIESEKDISKKTMYLTQREMDKGMRSIVFIPENDLSGLVDGYSFSIEKKILNLDGLSDESWNYYTEEPSWPYINSCLYDYEGVYIGYSYHYYTSDALEFLLDDETGEVKTDFDTIVNCYGDESDYFEVNFGYMNGSYMSYEEFLKFDDAGEDKRYEEWEKSIMEKEQEIQELKGDLPVYANIKNLTQYGLKINEEQNLTMDMFNNIIKIIETVSFYGPFDFEYYDFTGKVERAIKNDIFGANSLHKSLVWLWHNYNCTSPAISNSEANEFLNNWIKEHNIVLYNNTDRDSIIEKSYK